MRFLFVLAVTSWVWAAPQTVAAQDQTDSDRIAAAFVAITARDWEATDQYIRDITDPAGRDLVTWQRLRRGNGDWTDYVSFINSHLDWPGLQSLREQGEDTIPTDAKPSDVFAYFAPQPPQTGTGSLRLAAALSQLGQPKNAQAEAARAWTTMTLSAAEETALLNQYKDSLSAHHPARLDMLLWNGSTTAAARMIPLVSGDLQKLAKARIALQNSENGVDAAINAVPDTLRLDGGLAYDRFIWRVKKSRWDDAQALLAEQSADVKNLGRPEKWANRRRTYARRAMRMGDFDQAYWLASQHGLTEGADYADLEWVAGYIALAKLDAPEQAAIHFKNHFDAVQTPVSLGRAGYWQGRAAEALKDFDAAADFFRQGAEHQTSFYGQLAAERIGAEPDPALVGLTGAPNWRDSAIAQTGPVRAGILLHRADSQYLMRWFLSHVAETTDQTESAQLSQLALDMDRPYVALAIAKEAAKRGIILPQAYFPVTDLAAFSGPVAPEVAMAIARRESELNPEAVSPVGARGLMQVMPATAQQVAKEIDVAFSKTRLTTDWKYNAQLGTAYLGGLLDRYDGSFILAFAAYNAGPNRADRWIKDYGDPRDGSIDQIDWIEQIPYRETRDYVMRVSESLFVYRMRLSGTVKPLRLSKDLIGG